LWFGVRDLWLPRMRRFSIP